MNFSKVKTYSIVFGILAALFGVVGFLSKRRSVPPAEKHYGEWEESIGI